MAVATYEQAGLTYNDASIPYNGIGAIGGLRNAPHYRIQLWDMSGAGFGPGALIAEFQQAVNLGWAHYLNDVPECFFTISQDDPKISLLTSNKTNAHIKIYRNETLVWAGILGEWEANERDVIVYGYGYLAILFILLSDWNVAYTNAGIATIVSDAWTRAKTTLTSSLVSWVTTGIIETPATTSGGSTGIILPSYRMFYKRVLQILREMAAIGIGDTTNSVVFEITPDGTFNFWKNRGTDTDIRWEYGDRKVKSFSEGNAPMMRRNNLLSIGINPNDVTLKYEKSDSFDITAKGRRQEPVFYSWVRDSTELSRAVDARAAQLVRDDVDVQLEFYPNSIAPAGVGRAGWRLSDRMTVKIDRGATSIDGLYMAVGQTVLFMRGQERVRVMLQQRPGA